MIAGFALGELVGSLIFKSRPYPPDIWHDYRMQAGSWVNSVLVHAIALTLLLLPYILSRMWQPVKMSTRAMRIEHDVSVAAKSSTIAAATATVAKVLNR